MLSDVPNSLTSRLERFDTNAAVSSPQSCCRGVGFAQAHLWRGKDAQAVQGRFLCKAKCSCIGFPGVGDNFDLRDMPGNLGVSKQVSHSRATEDSLKGYGCFQKIGALYRSPYQQDYSMFGAHFGAPHVWKLPYRVSDMATPSHLAGHEGDPAGRRHQSLLGFALILLDHPTCLH